VESQLRVITHAKHQAEICSVIYVDVAEELQREAVDKLGFLFEEREE
jgi:hypothetical protein